MLRFFIYMLGMLTTSRAGSPRFTSDRGEDRSATRELPNPSGPQPDGTPRVSRARSEPSSAWRYSDGGEWWPGRDEAPSGPAGGGPSALERGPGRARRFGRGGRRRWIPVPVKWGVVILLIGLIFRKAVAWAVLVALSSALHLVGVNVHLPHVKLSWPWQSISAGTTSNIDLGPWVLQKIEGISKPALGTANFNFTFTHKVTKNIGIWPCWYSSTFDAAGHASATVNLNPGAGWWAPSRRCLTRRRVPCTTRTCSAR